MIDYRSPGTKQWTKPSGSPVAVVFLGVAAFGLMLLAWTFLSKRTSDNPYHGHWGACLVNLREIGHGVFLYRSRHGVMPSDFVAMIDAKYLVPAALVCPASNDVRSIATQPAEIRSAMKSGGYCSYLYVGDALPAGEPSATDVIAFERIANHPNHGINVLFGDGRVEEVDPQVEQFIRTQHAAGIRPVLAHAKADASPP